MNTNGLISFERHLADYSEILFDQHNVSYISPFWTDIDTRYNGDIFHREIKDDHTKDLINEEIKRFSDLPGIYNLTFAYIITWLKVGEA